MCERLVDECRVMATASSGGMAYGQEYKLPFNDIRAGDIFELQAVLCGDGAGTDAAVLVSDRSFGDVGPDPTQLFVAVEQFGGTQPGRPVRVRMNGGGQLYVRTFASETQVPSVVLSFARLFRPSCAC
jgi:hypothetical protein